MGANKKIIFVGGIHGVGKTVLCRSLVERLGGQHVIASDLIRRLNVQPSNEIKRVKNINRNQEVLVSAIDEFLQNEERYFLDGHFCLFGEDGSATEVGLEVFSKIAPQSIILVNDDIDNVIQRLNLRDSVIHDVDRLWQLQQCELESSEIISKSLNIQRLLYSPGDELLAAIEFVKAAWSS